MQTVTEREMTYPHDLMFDGVDRMLATVERRLPALPAAGVKLQRSVNERVRSVMDQGADTMVDSLGTVAGSTKTAADTVVGTVRWVTGRTVDTAVVGAKTAAGQAKAQAGSVVDTMTDEAQAVADEMVDLAEQTTEAVADAAEAMAPDYDEMTKAELYDLAQDRDLDGRSTMNKAQLVKALCADDRTTD